MPTCHQVGLLLCETPLLVLYFHPGVSSNLTLGVKYTSHFGGSIYVVSSLFSFCRPENPNLVAFLFLVPHPSFSPFPWSLFFDGLQYIKVAAFKLARTSFHLRTLDLGLKTRLVLIAQSKITRLESFCLAQSSSSALLRLA